MKKLFSILLTVLLTASFVMTAFAAQTARSIVIFEIAGSDVTMTKGTARSFKASTNQRMANGYTVSTGKASYCWLKLDGDSLVKADQNSKLQFGDAKGRKLSISVLSGAITVDAAAQKSGNAVDVKAGNSALAIRGTLFVVENLPGNKAVVTMLTGGGDVNGIPLEPGEVMYIYDTQEQKVFEKGGLAVDDDLSLAVLEAIMEYLDDVVASGVIDAAEAEEIAASIEALIEEKKAQNEMENAQPEDIENDIIRLGEEDADSGGSDSGLSGGSGGRGNSSPTLVDVTDLINNASGTVEITEPSHIPAGQTATLDNNSALIVSSTLSIDGTLRVEQGALGMLINSGAEVTVTSSDTWEIAGTVQNSGTITNTDTGKIVLEDTALFANEGTFAASEGLLEVEDGATIMWQSGSISGIPALPAVPGIYIYDSASWEYQVATTGGSYFTSLAGALAYVAANPPLDTAIVSLIGTTTIGAETVPGNVTLRIQPGVILNDEEGLHIVNGGRVENSGTINAGRVGLSNSIMNYGTLVNGDTGIINLSDGVGLSNYNGASTTNNGAIHLLSASLNNNGGTFTNNGTITVSNAANTLLKNSNNGNFLNDTNGRIDNSREIENDSDTGTFTNKGIIVNEGIINNTRGSFDSTVGTITGSDDAQIVIVSGSVTFTGATYDQTKSPLTWGAGSWVYIAP